MSVNEKMLTLDKKEKRIQKALGTFPMVKVSYDSNNSGGSWWLKDKDWFALEKVGWTVEWKKDQKGPIFGTDPDGRWLGALATSAYKTFETLQEGIDEWEDITGQCASDEGCECCGEPHNFSGETSDGKSIDE